MRSVGRVPVCKTKKIKVIKGFVVGLNIFVVGLNVFVVGLNIFDVSLNVFVCNNN